MPSSIQYVHSVQSTFNSINQSINQPIDREHFCYVSSVFFRFCISNNLTLIFAVFLSSIIFFSICFKENFSVLFLVLKIFFFLNSIVVSGRVRFLTLMS